MEYNIAGFPPELLKASSSSEDFRLSWTYLKDNFTDTPTIQQSNSDNTIYKYTYQGVSKYRRVYVPYSSNTDNFYTDAACTDLMASRG